MQLGFPVAFRIFIVLRIESLEEKREKKIALQTLLDCATEQVLLMKSLKSTTCDYSIEFLSKFGILLKRWPRSG